MEQSPNIPATLGRYEVVGFLAAGGMAELFLGRLRGPSGFTRPVVLKRILPHLARQQSFVDMFLDEARLVARVRHPNVVQVHELTHETGELFMAMEYLEGENFAGLVRRLVSRAEALEPAIAACIVAQACAGLHAAHELVDDDGRSLGVVHRDVSPHNLFITFDGVVKVLDFGVARAHDRVARTEAGQVKGKLDYLSPEQCLSQDIDRRADVFALGVVLYELLTLRRLFKRPAALSTLKAILEEPLIPPSRVSASCPRELDEVCMRALAREPGDRYATAADMQRALMAACHFEQQVLPEEVLRALMVRLFPDRKQEKDALLRRVREGAVPGPLPDAEVDVEVEVPDVGPAPVVPTATPIVTHVSPPRRGPLVLAMTLTVLAAAAVLVNWNTPGEPPHDVTPLPAPTATPTEVAPSPVPETPSRSQAQLVITSSPPGATVRLDGEWHGVTPATIPIDKRDAGVVVFLLLDNYFPLQKVVAADRDQQLHFSLEPHPRTHETRPRRSAGDDPLNEKW